MKGLILKDILNFKNQQGKTFLLLTAIYFIIALQMHSSSYFAGVWMIIGVSLPISSIAYDEKAKWDKYALTMPVTRKDIVTEKYLLAALCVVTGNIISLPITAVIDKGLDMESLLVCGLMIGIGFLFNAVILPFVFRFGSENARTIMIIVMIAIPFLAAYLLSKLDLDIAGILEQNAKMIGMTAVVSVVVIYVVSYVISVLIMERKEIA